VHIVVKKQSTMMLNEQTQEALHKNLLAMAKAKKDAQLLVESE